MKKTAKIAIVVCIVLGLSYWVIETQQKRAKQEEYEAMRKGLLLLSEEYNKGFEKVQYLKAYEESEHKILKGN